MDISRKTLAKRYARAYMGLSGAAYSQEREDASKARISALKKVFSSAEPYRKTLVHPAVNGGIKEEILEKILGPASAAGPAGGLAKLLVAENRFDLFEGIVEESLRIHENFCGVIKAEVRSRYDIEEKELKRIERALSKATSKKVHLTQMISEGVIGGIEIKVGDFLIDATIRGRLELLKKGVCEA